MTRSSFIVDLLIGWFSRGFLAKNFPCILYFPRYEDVVRCESSERAGFVQRIRFMFKVFSLALYCCWLAPYTLGIQVRCATQHQYWLLTCCCITLCGTEQPVGGVLFCATGGFTLYLTFRFLLFVKERKKEKEKWDMWDMEGYTFEDSAATRGALRSFQSETR